MVDRIAIDALKPGMVIVKITQQNGPVRIRKSGLVSSDAMVLGLREMGVLELEIDPDQTVDINAEYVSELQTQPAKQSQTQFLLQSNISKHESAGSQASTEQDSQLAEQFNRSLFLPTAQDIPETWQVHTKKAALGLGVILLGFGLGFGAASITKNGGLDKTVLAYQNQETQDELDVTQQNSEEFVKTIQSKEALADDISQQPSESQVNIDKQNQSTAQELVANAETVIDKSKEMLVLGMQPGTQAETTGQTGNTQVDAEGVGADPLASQVLLKKFQLAMAEMEQQETDEEVVDEPTFNQTVSDVPRVDEMPDWILSSLPKMSFNAHMFASEPVDRWVKVNGVELGEGDWIDGQLRVERIEQQHVILNFQGHEFSMLALSEW